MIFQVFGFRDLRNLCAVIEIEGIMEDYEGFEHLGFVAEEER